MSTSTQVDDLKINKLTKQQYEGITPSNTELYFVTDDSGITSSDVTTALGYTPVNSDVGVTHTKNTATGSATQPVYIASDGTATATTYSLAKSVPSDAKFTDTTYSVFTGANGTTAGTSGLVKKPEATDNTKFLKGDGTWATPDSVTTTDSVTSGSTAALTSGGAYTNVVRRLSSSAATGSASQGVYVDANGQVQACTAVTSTYSSTGTAPINGTGVASALSGLQSADTAVTHTKNTAAGSATNPVYVNSSGVATATTYTLGKSVPSDAVFTDTNTKVTQNVSSTNGTYPILLCPTADATTNQGEKTSIFASGVKVNPSTSTISATFSGNLTGNVTGNVTGNCSGSSGSCTGNASTATTASKLGSSDVGSATKGIYLDDGEAKACTYSVSKDVPSDAVFTDTTYSAFTGSDGTTAGSSGLVPAPAKADNTKFLKGDGTWATPTGGTVDQSYSSTSTNAQSGTAVAQAVSGLQSSSTAVKHTASTAVGSATQPVYVASDGTATVTTYTLGKSVPSDAVFTDTNTKVTQNVSSTNSTYPILLCPTADATTSQGEKTSIFASGVKVNPGTGTISATTFSGALTGNVTGNCSGSSGSCTGNAATATSATTASKLGSADLGSATKGIYLDDGTPKACTYSVSKDVPSDALFTDTKNTAGSTNTSSKIFLVGATSQGANPQTYSNSNVYVNTDGTLNAVTPTSSTNDTTVATTKFVKDQGYTSNVGTVTSVNNVSPTNGNVTLTIPTTTDSVTSGSTAALTSGGAYTNVVTAVAAHSTDANKINVTKAGSTTTITVNNVASATTASKLGSSNVGTATKGIYLNAGTATACTYSVGKDVPSDAVFTDTTYSVFTGANGTTAGTSGLVKAPAATDNTKFLKGDGTWATPTVDQTYNSTSANAQSGVAIAGAGFLQNTATGNYALTVGGTASTATSGTNVGISSTASGGYGTALGYAATGGARATGLGWNAKATGADSIQIGNGTNSTAKTLSVGFYNTGNYQLLDGATGLIPIERIPQTLQPITPVTYAASQTITLSVGSSIYKITNPNGNITSMSFSLASSIVPDNTAYTFELIIDMSTTVRGVAWPSSVAWQDGEIPDLSQAGVYLFAFRTLDKGSHWIGNLQGRWASIS